MQITFDCADPDRLAPFWAKAQPGYDIQPPPPGFATWQDFLVANDVPEDRWNDRSAVVGDGPRLFFQRVPEPKTTKNRVHLDLQAGGTAGGLEEQRAPVRAEVERLTALGASLLDELEEMGEVWAVMTDPEGNEFCV